MRIYGHNLLSQAQAVLSPGDTLGLVIRGGAEYGVGIYVLQVDRGSVAQNIGLKVSSVSLSTMYISSSKLHSMFGKR